MATSAPRKGKNDARQQLPATTRHTQRSLLHPSVLPAQGVSPISGPNQFHDPGRHRRQFLLRLDLLHAVQIAPAP